MSASAGRRRWLAGGVGAVLILAAVVAGFVVRGHLRELPPRQPSSRPELLVLTSLPIVFPESFTLDASPSPALAALRSRYKVVPISIADAKSLKGHRLLLMAQPQAQPAEVLVQLDSWVRQGGHVLLLADPVLEWPSERPLGDALRPPLAFADTGLLIHWGLRLDAPDRLGPETFVVGGNPVHTLSPGKLVATSRACSVLEGSSVAQCKVGRGEAIVIADADFLDVERRRAPARSGNVDFLIRQLATLEQ